MPLWHLVVGWPKWLLLLQLLTESFLFAFQSWKVAPTWLCFGQMGHMWAPASSVVLLLMAVLPRCSMDGKQTN